MIKIIISFLLLFNTYALAQNQQTIIKTEALKMARALAALDLETYASYCWPELVNDPRTKEMLKKGVDSVEKYRKQFGLRMKSIIIGNPSAVEKHKGVMQCTIPQNLTVEAFLGSITTESILIALSTDGKQWYFADANLFKNTDAKSKLPELSPKLLIPPTKAPILKDKDGKEIKQ